jgi:hypothetical protein
MERDTRRFSGFSTLLVSALLCGVPPSAAAAGPSGTDYQLSVTNFPGSGSATLHFDGSRKPVGASGLTISETHTTIGPNDWVEFALKTENGEPFLGQESDALATADAQLTDLVWSETGLSRFVQRNTTYAYFTADGEVLPLTDPLGVGLTFIGHPLKPGVTVVLVLHAPVSTALLTMGTGSFTDQPAPLSLLLQGLLSADDAARVNGIHIGFAAVEEGDVEQPPPPPPPPPPPDGENQPPTADAGPDQTVEATSSAGANVTLAGSGSDPDGDPLSFSWSGPFGTANGSGPTVTIQMGSHTLTLTVDDGNGGSDSDEVVITVVDTTPPALTVPSDQTLEATGPSGAPYLFSATATDIADPAPTVNCVPASGSTFPLGTTTVTCTATDASGNHVEGSFNVTVRDTTPPSVTAPPDVTVAATGPLTAVNLEANGPASATDAVGVVSGPTPDNPGPFAPGIVVVTWTARDAAGNEGSDTQTVSVLFNFGGFLSPVGNPPTVNVVKAGRGIAIKWQLTDGAGGFISDVSVVTGTQSTPVSCTEETVDENPVDTDATGQSGLRYDSTDQQFVYVWDTPSGLAGQCADFILSLSDGSDHRARFAFR